MGSQVFTPAALQAPLRSGFPAEAAWKSPPLELPVLAAQSCPTLCDPVDCSPRASSVHGDSPGNNTGVGSRSPPQGIFPTRLSHQGSLLAGVRIPAPPHPSYMLPDLSVPLRSRLCEADGCWQKCHQPHR